ncbi:MAG: GatB/YqeY domain-containing protein [Oceanobacter sp.]
MSTLVEQVKASVKDAMRAKNKERLGALRLITAEFKKVEVDERIEVTDERALALLDKMVKQRRDSIAQYTDAGRDELAEKEQFEIDVISDFLPTALTEEEISAMVDEAIAESGASSMQQMGSVMGILKPKVQGRADMGVVSKLVKAKFG